jgi:hypothetical protein
VSENVAEMTTAALRPSRTRWLAVSALYVGLTLLYAHPMLRVIGSALPNDTGDPGLNAWILWWNAHAVPLTAHWWDGPVFYPARGAMALSETFLNLVPLSSPLQWAGASAVLTYNLMFLLSFPAAALGAHALAYRLTGRHDAALVAGLAFGFSPYRAAQMPHLQTLWSCWMPLGLYALHRYLADRRRWQLALFGVCWAMNGFATGYFLFYFAVLVGIWMLWFVRTWRDLLAIGVTLVLATLPLVPLLAGYQRFQSAFGLSRRADEIQMFSADLSAIWATTDAIVSHWWTMNPRPEGELYPGVAILALTIAGVIAAWRRAPALDGAPAPGRSRWYAAQLWLLGLAALMSVVTFISWRAGGWSTRVLGLLISFKRVTRTMFITLCLLTIALAWNRRVVDAWRRRSPILFYTAASLLMLLCALGPIARLNGVDLLDQTQTPYAWLMELPGGHAFRVPARFATLFILCLSTAGALALTHVTLRPRAWLAFALAATIAIDGWVPRMHMAPIPPIVNFAGLDRGAVVLELPMVDQYSDTAAMLGATESGHVLVNGFSGYEPPHYGLLQDAVRRFDPSILVALQRIGPLLVFIHQGDLHDKYTEFVEQAPKAHRVQTTAAGTLFQLPGISGSRDPDQTRAISAITLANDDSATAAMVDGNLETRAVTAVPQAPGDQLVITFDKAIVSSAVELDLGRFEADHPRTLRISAANPGAPPWLVWEGGTRGAATVGVLDDRTRRALTIDLPLSPPARQLILTIVEGDASSRWSIAELKVFGR